MLKRIGKYQVQRELGRGSCGRVYLASDPGLGRLVAIKLITQRDEHMLARFRREAAATAALSHPNIVTMYEFGEDMGIPFIAMEYLDGELLSEIIDEGHPLPVVEKARLMWQVAEGLRAAHEAGVVHRDIKPANLMVLPGGTVKIMDFGIARLTGQSVTPITRKGDLLGTYMYMSPEQVHSPETADARSDIFSYGAVYYELLTGQPPFVGNDVAELVEAIKTYEPPPIPSLLPECPEALDAVIRQALRKDRRRRYRSMEELQMDAGAALAGLRQERAQELAAQARQAYSAGELERTSLLVQEILELDPANAVARRLREAVRSHGRQEARGLVERGERELGRNRLSRAVDLFRSALRLDGSNAAVQKKLRDTEARLAANRAPEASPAPGGRSGAARRLETATRQAEPAAPPPPAKSAAALLEEADRLWRQQKLTQARRKAAAALEAETSNDRAQRMLELIDRQIGRRRDRREKAEDREAEPQGQKQAIQVTLAQLAALEKRGDLRGARMLLQAALQHWPEAPELKEACKRVEGLLAGAAAPSPAPPPRPPVDRFKQAQALIADSRFSEAQRLLRELAAQTPGDRRVQVLLRELERHQRR